jgi:hypothetical protein
MHRWHSAFRIGRCTTSLLVVILAGTAAAELIELRIDAIEPFAEGVAFGEAGPYQRIVATAHGELDPADPHNAGIELLDGAPRNERDRVEYEVDVFLLAPVGGSDVLLYDVTNRGSKVALGLMNEAGGGSIGHANDPRTLEHAGNGFLLKRGYAIVWSGWDPSASSERSGMRARFPIAMRDGAPIRGRVRDEFSFGIFPAEVPVAARLSYPALRDAPAELSVRRRERDPARKVPAEDWVWLDEQRIALREGPFETGALYDLRYSAAGPPVLGIGFAAARDLVSFLRHDAVDRHGRANPLRGRTAPRARFALGMGVSQSGRFLRHFLDLGMNRDTEDRRVFDGLLPYIAGAGKVFANHSFGQPGRTAGQHIARLFPENWYPFAHGQVADPLTGGDRGLLRGDGFDPKIIEVNTGTEYWHKGASLVHTDPLGARDLPLPESVRLFLIAGTEHAGGMLIRDETCVNRGNPHRPNAALRALLVALDEWVREGREPPASRIPRLADATLVPLEAFRFPAIPGAAVAARMNRIRVPDDWVEPPSRDGVLYGAHLPQVDADGNEVAGLRLPPIAVPLATYTGWNVFASRYLAPDLCGRSGSFLPLPIERDPADPRAAIRERYPTHAAYVKQVRDAAWALRGERLLLAEDAERYVAEASAHEAPWRP